MESHTRSPGSRQTGFGGLALPPELWQQIAWLLPDSPGYLCRIVTGDILALVQTDRAMINYVLPLIYNICHESSIYSF